MKRSGAIGWLCSALMTSATVAFVHNCRRRHPVASSHHRFHIDYGQISSCTNVKRPYQLQEGDDGGVHPLSKLRQTSYDALLKRIPPSVRVVLIGEGTHGTEEFFCIRSEVTQCLVLHRGFDAVVCEGDVQPFFELNEFVTGDQEAADNTMGRETADQEIHSVLSHLFCSRFPDWMWSNMPMVSFTSWVRSHNCNNQQNPSPVQLFGMDIQSPFDSMDYIIRQLPAMGQKALSDSLEKLYEPLFRYRNNIRSYGNDVYGNKVPSQEHAVKNALDALLRKWEEKNTDQSEGCTDDARERRTWFRIIQNAHAINASEAYHRQRIYPGHTTTWNLRTESMMNNILRSMEFIDRMNRINAPTRLIVWAHNSHVGDMRSTGYSSLGQISLGQMLREKIGDDGVFLIGTTTYEGTVRAARANGQGACSKGEGEVMALKKAMTDSHEDVLHSIATDLKHANGEQSFGLYLQGMRANETGADIGSSRVVPFNCERNERFVGSCYLPQTEMMSHYTKCNMATQFDYIIHVDESSAITV